MTDKEHSITVNQPATDWEEPQGPAKTIPDIELMNIFIAQKQFTEDSYIQHNVLSLLCISMLSPQRPYSLSHMGIKLVLVLCSL